MMRQRNARYAACLCAILAGAAFAAGTKPAPASAATDQPATLTASDHIFIADALVMNQKEIDASNVAIKKATSDKVRQFAQTMVREHTQLGADLQKIGGSTFLPPAPNPEGSPNIADRKGAEFDKAYMDLMVTSHDEAEGKFTVVSVGSQHSAAVRTFASRTLPTIRKHDEMAKTVDRSLPKP